MSKISICIPTYEMRGLGRQFLEESFNILDSQTFKDFEVVISDHSQNNDIKDLCETFSNKLNISYYKNLHDRGNSSANINNAIKNAKGDLIKILFQDDFLYSKNSLEQIISSFDLNTVNWLVTPCIHTNDGFNFYRPFYPYYNKAIHLGKNTISSPSVLTIRNNKPLFFDEKLIWLMDCDYYKRCYDNFGEPKITEDINVVNRVGEHQVTNSIVNLTLKLKELFYSILKHGI